MKSIRKNLSGLAIIGGLIASLNFVHAQTATVGSFNGNIAPVQSAQPDSIVSIVAEAQGLPLVPPDQVPPYGTFWWVMPGGAAVPTPCPPQDLSAPIYQIADGQFLVDETGGQVEVVANARASSLQAASTVSTVTSALEAQATALVTLITQVQTAAANQQMQTMAGSMMAMDVPMPGDGGDGGTNSYTSNESSFVSPDYGTNLWIAQVGVSSGSLVGVVSNSSADISYEIQSLTDLTQAGAGWNSEGFILGSELTNWTPMSVAQNGRTNLFLRIRSWADSTGSGIPDWWQMQYFGYVGVDPYGNPMGDGWNNLQKFQNGMNPNVFYTPPAPQGVTVLNNMAANQATIQWQPSPGQVTGYTVEKTDANAGTVQDFYVGTNSYQDNISGDSPGRYSGNNYEVSYRVQALYSSGGASAWSASVPLQQAPLSGSIVPGANGATYLLVSGLPENATTVRLVYYDNYATWWYNDFSFNTYRDISVSAFTNGATLLPASWQSSGVDIYGNTNTADQIQSVDINGNASAASWLNPIEWNLPFYDGRVQLKQNLIFLLREPNEITPFTCAIFDTNGQKTASIIMPSTYAYAGYYDFNAYYYGVLPESDVLRPFTDNYFYRNFVFTTGDVDVNGDMTTGIGNSFDYWNNCLILQIPLTYQFQSCMTNQTPIPALLGTTQTPWLCSYPTSPPFADPSEGGLEPIGITYSFTDGGFEAIYTLANNARNFFGLPFQSVNIAYQSYDANFNPTGTLETQPLSPGSSFTVDGWNLYPQMAQPQFQTVEYDFWNPNWTWNPSSQTDVPPILPGYPNFSPTNTSQQFFISPGQQIQIAGYAKLAVLNGYPGVYAYLGQYFDQAYKEDANGNATTNTTGVLSPYGQFFATEPGPAALMTMPDIDPPYQRGTCTVYCASAQVDKNNDGNMDLSFNGPDATSQASPMECWVNDGHDQPGVNGNLDTDWKVPPATTNYAAGEITCPRDLENFFRLWICGMPQLPVGQGYAVTLSMSPVSGNPAINLYYSCETNGSIGYLTNTDVAATQTGSAYYANALCTISNSQSYTLQMDSYGNLLYTHFLFEGAGIGEGQLTLTISQNGNTIAQTGVWLDLHDVKDFYERAVITNNISGSISNWTSGLEGVQPAASSVLGNDTNLIVFVHGINVGPWDWLDDSDTAFKRLYWAGYHGKFMTVKWPCNYLTPPQPLSFDVFNLSEANAYKASTSLTTYLNQLRSRFPGYRVNLYVHSQGNAVASEAIKNGAPFDTYILTQGAISDGAYDVNATNYPVLVNEEYGNKITPEWQPMGYHGVYTNSNFSGKIVNFYNTNDPVLALWIVDQVDLKPAGGYFYDGVNCRYTISSNIVTDFQETRSMVSRSRSLSVGQSPPESPHGVITSAVDLNTRYGFNNAFPADHSAQWTWPIQTTTGYYLQLLDSIKP